MSRGGIREKTNNIGRGPRQRSRSAPWGAPSRSFTFAILFSCGFDYRSSFFAPKPHENACYAGYGGPREQCCSVPRVSVKKKKGSVEDRESGGALCHGVALKKKKRERQRSVADRESGVALCHGVALKKKKKKKKKKKERERSVADRAISIALCHGVALKKGSVEDRERCRSMPRGGVKKKKRKKREICRGPSEQNRSVPRGGVKKKGSVEDRESGVALCHRVALKKRERDQSRTERAVSLCATGWR